MRPEAAVATRREPPVEELELPARAAEGHLSAEAGDIPAGSCAIYTCDVPLAGSDKVAISGK
jgi:hypothetical protein